MERRAWRIPGKCLRNWELAAGGDGETFLYTTDRGLKVGVYTAYHLGRTQIQKGITSLREAGAEVVIAAFHSGTEGSYTPTENQKSLFRYAIDCGADIVYNAHPHVLQPMESYHDGVIFYSLGNFCFGGNRNPSDKDTAIMQVTVERTEEGTVRLAEVEAIPCSVSSRSDRNDYQPTPYAEGAREPTGWSASWQGRTASRSPIRSSRRQIRLMCRRLRSPRFPLRRARKAECKKENNAAPEHLAPGPRCYLDLRRAS